MVCPTVGVHGGCMVTALAFGSSGQCLSHCQGHFGVFLGNTLYSHSALLRPGLKMGTGECHTGVTLRWTSIPFRGSRVPALKLEISGSLMSLVCKLLYLPVQQSSPVHQSHPSCLELACQWQLLMSKLCFEGVCYEFYTGLAAEKMY